MGVVAQAIVCLAYFSFRIAAVIVDCVFGIRSTTIEDRAVLGSRCSSIQDRTRAYLGATHILAQGCDLVLQNSIGESGRVRRFSQNQFWRRELAARNGTTTQGLRKHGRILRGGLQIARLANRKRWREVVYVVRGVRLGNRSEPDVQKNCHEHHCAPARESHHCSPGRLDIVHIDLIVLLLDELDTAVICPVLCRRHLDEEARIRRRTDLAVPSSLVVMEDCDDGPLGIAESAVGNHHQTADVDPDVLLAAATHAASDGSLHNVLHHPLLVFNRLVACVEDLHSARTQPALDASDEDSIC